MTPNRAIDEIREITETVFRANAEAADRELPTGMHLSPTLSSRKGVNGVLAGNIRLLAERGYFGLGIDTRYGGMGVDDFTRREFTEIIAATCGVTAFTQHQFHAGGSFVGNSQSEVLKNDLLPRLAAGGVICGVAFSHLRRQGPPAVTARRVDGGFIVDGHAPWVTGWSFLSGIILGAKVVNSEGDENLFAYVSKEGNEQSMIAGPPIELHVMNASDTVEIDLKGLFISESNVTGVRPAEELRRNDYCGISGHVFLPLGCARGGVRYLRDLAASRVSDRLVEIAGVLEREIDACRREAITWNGSCADMPDYKRHALGARTGAIELAVRAAHAAVAATGGTAQMLDHAPQRLMREAVFYTTLAQTPDVQTGTLDRLAASGSD